MEAFFFDTSVLIKHFLSEPGASRVNAVVETQGEIFISELAVIEGTSAFAKKIQNENIPPARFNPIIKRFLSIISDAPFAIVPLDDAVQGKARAVLSMWVLTKNSNLGSLAAIQLGTAMHLREKHSLSSLQFFTSDRCLANAAESQGFTVIDPAGCGNKNADHLS